MSSGNSSSDIPSSHIELASLPEAYNERLDMLQLRAHSRGWFRVGGYGTKFTCYEADTLCSLFLQWQY